jgi:hypothetical protein
MMRMRQTLLLAILITTVLVSSEPCSPFPLKATTAEEPTFCNPNLLPLNVQNRLKADFGSWRLQEPENLSDPAREIWTGKKPSGCPGIAVGFFQTAKEPSYAALLVPADHHDSGYRFVVFNRQPGQTAYEMTVVEKSDHHGASDHCIQKVPISEFFSGESKGKFQVQAIEAILMVDSGEQEYEADIYFWSNGRFRREPVDY